MFRNGKSAVECDPKKRSSGIETETGVEQEEVSLEVSLVGSTERNEALLPFSRIERKKPVLIPAFQSN